VRFGLGEARPRSTLALGLAILAALRLVLEILVVVEVLFTRSEYKLCAAVHAFEDAILKFRHNWPPLTTPTTVLIEGGGAQIPAARCLFHVPASLLPVPFTGKRLLDPQLLTRFQVKRVPLDFFDNVLLLDFALEAAQRVFQRFALLQLYFSQIEKHLPTTSDSSAGAEISGGEIHPFTVGRTPPGKFPSPSTEGTDIIGG
jgi:hypothetical protein